MTHRWSDLDEFLGSLSETEDARQCKIIADGLREPEVYPSHELMECRGCEKIFKRHEGVTVHSSDPFKRGFWCDACEGDEP